MFEEINTGCNLPAQIELYAIEGDEYHFLFIAKGGGSANKTYLYQETKATLTPENLLTFMKAKMKTLGTAACPPYHLAFVVGGTSAELNLKTVKLASAGYLDNFRRPETIGHAFRDMELEEKCSKYPRTRYRCTVRRKIFLPGHTGRPASKARRILPHRSWRQLQCGPEYKG